MAWHGVALGPAFVGTGQGDRETKAFDDSMEA